MLKRALSAILALSAGLSLALFGVSAANADYLYCEPATNFCYMVIEAPAVDPPASPDPVTGFTPGASQCLYEKGDKNVEIPCSTNGRDYWSNNRQCYVETSPIQPPAPPGGDPAGAWYTCTPYNGPLRCDPAVDGVCRDPFGATFWSNTPPPGIQTLTPQQAAWILIRSFQIRGIEVGFAPDPNIPGSKSYVGVPIWMWANNPQPLTYGPYTQTATLGGVTITATAQVTSILWNMGDGNTVACANAGTPFLVQYGAVSSPTCGYRYALTSDDAPGGRYNVTATSQWQVSWSGGGAGGVIPLTAQSTTTVEINELQSVNINPNGD